MVDSCREWGGAGRVTGRHEQSRGAKFADNDHRLLAAILERPFEQFRALTADDGSIQRTIHGGCPLWRAGGRSSCRRRRGRRWRRWWTLRGWGRGGGWGCGCFLVLGRGGGVSRRGKKCLLEHEDGVPPVPR